MNKSFLKRTAAWALRAGAVVVLLNAASVHADEFGDPPICMKRPHLPQCNPDPIDPPPQDPWPCDFSPYGCGWF